MSMRFKSVSLLYAVRPPWSPNYTDHLEPPLDYEIKLIDGLLHVLSGEECKLIIPVTMMRSAVVRADDEKRVPEPPRVGMEPQVIQLDPSPVKRRGRPPKNG